MLRHSYIREIISVCIKRCYYEAVIRFYCIPIYGVLC